MSDGPPRIFDRHVLALHSARARRIAGDAFLEREAMLGLAERIEAVQRRFENALLLDGSDAALDILRPLAMHWTRAELDAHENVAPPGEGFDLVVSVLSLHSVNDLPGVLLQIRRTLKPDGLFLAALFGGETLHELRAALAAAEIETKEGVSPRVAPFADVRDLGALLQRADFALPVADVERSVVRYRELTRLVADLRAMGETNALVERDRRPLSRLTFAAAIAHYGDSHSDEAGRLKATFDIVFLTGWSPHESQQQPLRPGSATARLADALHTTEQSAGEAAPNPRGRV